MNSKKKKELNKISVVFLLVVALISLHALFVSAEARPTNLLNWKGQFYGCGMDAAEIFYLNTKFAYGAPLNININCHQFSDADTQSKHYCDLNTREWKLATENYDGSTFTDVFIDAEKSNNIFKNLVKNGGFESDTIAPWDSGETTTEQKKSGAKSLKLSSSGEIKQNIAEVIIGKKYVLSGYIKINDTAKLEEGEIVLELAWFEAEGTPKSVFTSPLNKNTPHIDSSFVHVSKTIEVTGTIPDSPAVVLLKATNAGSNAEIYFDDIKLIELNSEPTSACCPSTYCWDGSVCIEGKTKAEIANEKPYVTESDEKGYYCIKDADSAEWKEYRLIGGCAFGFCPDAELGCVPEGTTRPATIDPENPFLESICKENSEWTEFENQEVLFYDTKYYGCNIDPALLGLKYLDGSVLKDLFGENNKRSMGLCQLPYNYVKNNGFENSASDWTEGTISTTAIYGNNSLTLTSPEKAEQSIDFGPSPRKDFVIRVWYRSGNIEIKRGSTPIVKCGCEDGCSDPIAYGPRNWKLCQGEFRTSGEKTIRISPIEGTASIDNVEIFTLTDEDVDPRFISFGSDPAYQCSGEGWQVTSQPTTQSLTDTPKQKPKGIAAGQPESCCPADSCWTGGACQAPIELGAGGLLEKDDKTNKYFCAEGVWNPVSTKTKPDGSSGGFCDDDSNCYVGADPVCVEPGTYGKYISGTWNPNNGDHYCELVNGEGIWTSRTKLIAKALLEQKVSTNNDYTLFCDEKPNSLNNQPGTNFNNPFCVLQTGNEVIVGTALDENEKTLFLGPSGIGIPSPPTCNGLSDEDTFQSCGSSEAEVFYNPKTNSIFYTKETGSGGIWAAIESAINTILSWFGPTKSAEMPATIEQTVFNKVYVTTKGAKTIHGLIETKGDLDYMVIRYEGFSANADICTFVNNYPRREEFGIDCDGNTQTITAIQDTGDLDDVWQDLTSKLRIK